MTTDRELLEKAAKAAEIQIVGPVEKFIAQFEERQKGGFIVHNDRGGHSAWNPLTDDGDAFRLGVKVRAFGNPDFIRHLGAARFALQDQDDTAAYRRAIVWVAAAIGERMP